MLRRHDLAGLTLEPGAQLSTPCAVFEALARPSSLLNWRNGLPGLIVAGTVSTMQRVDDLKPRIPRGVQDLQHIRNAVIRLRDSPNATPNLASL
jgi:hypothetical protein